MGFLLVLNPASRASDDRSLPREARRRLRDVEVARLHQGTELGPLVEQALDEHRVVIAGGGDGTVSAVAQHVAGRGTLGVIPVGTLNHFARDLGIRDPEDALRALERGHTAEVDVGRANGRLFLNSTGMGIYPEIVRERELREDRIGKWLAAAGGALRVMAEAEPLDGTISADGDARAMAAWVVFVGNNRYLTTPGSVGARERLDEGVLDLRLVTVGKRRARRSRMAWRILRSRQWRTRRLVRRDARAVEISLEGPPRLVSADGETLGRTDRLQAQIVPRGLRVVAPPPR